MPAGIFSYIWRTSGRHQIALLLITGAVFLLTMAPLELQRRIVNGALGKEALGSVLLLCLGYVGVAVVAGGLKLSLNVYRGWVSETAVLDLRERVYESAVSSGEVHVDTPKIRGQALAMIVAEVEPVGGFTGMSVSEPVLQTGILLSVFGYMLFLHPPMAAIAVALFVVQIVFVPLMQRAITRHVKERIQTVRRVSADLAGDWSDFGGGLRQRYKRQVKEVFGLNMRVLWLKYTMNFLMNLTNHLGIVGVLIIGALHVAEGQMEVGTVVAFLSGLARVNDPWGDLVNYFRELTIASTKYGLIKNVLCPRDGG